MRKVTTEGLLKLFGTMQLVMPKMVLFTSTTNFIYGEVFVWRYLLISVKEPLKSVLFSVSFIKREKTVLKMPKFLLRTPDHIRYLKHTDCTFSVQDFTHLPLGCYTIAKF